jgi:hypothetical protein
MFSSGTHTIKRNAIVEQRHASPDSTGKGMFKHLLIATDGSDLAKKAVD